MSFADDIRAFAEKAIKATSDNTNKIVEDLFVLNVSLSPTPSGKGGFSLGTIKNNWYASKDSPNTAYSGSVDASGSSSIASINALIASNVFLGHDSVVYLTNSTPWSYRADKIGWGSGDPTNDTGWSWSGRITPYFFTSTSVQTILSRYSG